jgi:TnpA family transposase
MVKGYKRIKILSDAEINDLYSLPKFTLEEKIFFFALNKKEKQFINKISDFPSKVHAILQLGYFKAKGLLFSFDYNNITSDLDYVLTEYFSIQQKHRTILLKARKIENNRKILSLLHFRDFNDKIHKELMEQSLMLVRIHANHLDIFRELLSQIQIRQIVLPGYTILQDIISLSINIEFKRIENIFREHMPLALNNLLSGMTKSDATINLSTLKIRPKNFKYLELKAECAKSQIYSEYYNLSKQLIDKGDAETISPADFWQSAYAILPKAQYLPTADYIAGRSFDFEAAKWKFYINKSKRIKSNLRMLFRSIEFCSGKKNAEIMQAISFLRNIFDKEKSLSKVAVNKYPDKFIPKKIKKYLYVIKVNDDDTAHESFIVNQYHPDKYEFYLYQNIVKEIDKGNIFCNDSTKYRSLSADLVSDKVWQNKDGLIKKLNYPNIAVNIEQRLDGLELELHAKILEVNRKIATKENDHIEIKENKVSKGQNKEQNIQDYKWHLTHSVVDERDDKFFTGVATINIGELLYFINDQTEFCRAFEHIKPRYSKQKANYEEVIACIAANGFGFGIYRMAQSCDVSYSTLSNIEKNFLGIENLREANDIISNKIAGLKVFNSWNILADKLLAAVDGQKFETRLDTMQARYSPKYFGLKKGIVPLSIVCNHVPINCRIIGANEHESHYTYDIIYNNSSDIDPDVISGDMHAINKVNFAVLDSINKLFMPNFSAPEEQVKNLRSMKPVILYKDCFIKPAKIINRKLIVEEWDNLQRIFISLATQESTQATIISKLSSHKRYSRIKNALWEYDAILKSLYLLDFIDDNILRSQIRKALNRVEAYHNLRRSIAKVYTGKFRGRNISENEVWNQCSRLLANAIILYNAIILDKLHVELTTQGNMEGVKYLTSVSPVRWQHINFIGKYEFKPKQKMIKMEDIILQLQNNLKIACKP